MIVLASGSMNGRASGLLLYKAMVHSILEFGPCYGVPCSPSSLPSASASVRGSRPTCERTVSHIRHPNWLCPFRHAALGCGATSRGTPTGRDRKQHNHVES